MLKEITGKSTVVDSNKMVGMVEREFYMLSNFSAHQVEVDGIIYPTLEHAYHASRFPEESIKEEIRLARSAMQAKHVSWKYKNDHQLKNWDEIKVDVMRKLCKLKLEQHTDVQLALARTGKRIIVEDIDSDSFWGTGPDMKGENMLGKIWMELRIDQPSHMRSKS